MFENIEKDDSIYDYTDNSKLDDLEENLNNVQIQSDFDSDITSENE